MRLYRDGVEVASGSHSGMASSPNTVTGLGATIGRSGDPQVSLFNGLIDDVRIYRHDNRMAASFDGHEYGIRYPGGSFAL